MAWGWRCQEGKNTRMRKPPPSPRLPPDERARRVASPGPQPPVSDLLLQARSVQNRRRATTNKRSNVSIPRNQSKIEHLRRVRRPIGNQPHFVLSEQTTAPHTGVPASAARVSELHGDILYDTYTKTPSDFSACRIYDSRVLLHTPSGTVPFKAVFPPTPRIFFLSFVPAFKHHTQPSQLKIYTCTPRHDFAAIIINKNNNILQAGFALRRVARCV